MDILWELNRFLSNRPNYAVVAESGDMLFAGLDVWVTRGGCYLAQGYYASMGFGVPGALGAQLGTGQRPIVLSGDGAFQMTGWELLNCGRYGWDPIVLVFNNASWEMLRVFQPESQFNDLDMLPFADIAENLGGDGYRAETRSELQQALARAAATRGKFQLVEIVLARGAISPTLQNFVNGLKRMREEHGG